MEKESVLENLNEWRRITRDRKIQVGNTFFNQWDNNYKLRHFPDDQIGPIFSEELKLTSTAEGQLLARLKIPAAYFHRCLSQLRSQNYNYWAQTEQFSKQNLVLRQVEDSEQLHIRKCIRAVVSRRYNTAFDDVHVIPQFLDTLLTDSSGYISTFEKSLEFTRLFIVFRDTHVERDGIIAEAGIVLTNSEVGMSCLHVRPYILWDRRFDLYDTMSSLSFYHSGQFDLSEILKAGLNQKEVAQAGLAQLLVRGTQTIENPLRQIQKLADRNEGVFSTRVLEMLRGEWEEQRNVSLLLVVRSILETVKDLPVFQKHLATEAVGRYLNLFGDAEARVRAMVREDLDEIPIGIVIDKTEE